MQTEEMPDGFLKEILKQHIPPPYWYKEQFPDPYDNLDEWEQDTLDAFGGDWGAYYDWVSG